MLTRYYIRDLCRVSRKAETEKNILIRAAGGVIRLLFNLQYPLTKKRD